VIPWADIALGLAAGIGLGALHLGWLWAGLGRAGGLGRGALAVQGAGRIAVVLLGLWLLARSAGQPGAALIAALIGMILMRAVVLCRLRGRARRR